MTNVGFILVMLGIVLIMLGFLLLVIETMHSVYEKHEIEYNEKKIEGGGVVLIGPIPIVFGSDKKYALIAMVLAIVIMLLYIMLSRV